ncbi:hypothetical protein ACTXT7_013725 [Hymenolepis weldensis]
MKQMNLSKTDKDSEDYIKNVGKLHYEPSVGEVFATRYAQNRDCQECNSYGHKEDSARAVNDDRIQTAEKASIRLNVAKVHGILTTMQIDSGSDITIVSNEAWKTLGSPKLDAVPFKVSSASGDAM